MKMLINPSEITIINNAFTNGSLEPPLKISNVNVAVIKNVVKIKVNLRNA